MLDEIGIPRAFKSSEKDGKTKYEAEFLYLSQYESINFIICIRPQAYGDQDVELNYPNDSQYQLYKRLPNRYRNTKKILEFIKYWQDYGFLDLTNEIIIDQGQFELGFWNSSWFYLQLSHMNNSKKNPIDILF